MTEPLCPRCGAETRYATVTPGTVFDVEGHTISGGRGACLCLRCGLLGVLTAFPGGARRTVWLRPLPGGLLGVAA